ncbi:MAG: hypothetical protein IBJ11_04410 [Phycisphaerales bacterium]|nr:hypothetical protein [Phycisphaerales bacterium]
MRVRDLLSRLALCAAAWSAGAAGVSAQGAPGAPATPPTLGDLPVVGGSPAVEVPVIVENIWVFHVTTKGRVVYDGPIQGYFGNRDGGVRVCNSQVTRSAFPFDTVSGGFPTTAQAGFETGTYMGASFTNPNSDFPLKVNNLESFWVKPNANSDVTVQWQIDVWQSNPTGTIGTAPNGSYASDGSIVPHMRIPPGTNAAKLIVSVDPSDPDQIILPGIAGGPNDPVTWSFSFKANLMNQGGSPCLSAPPQNNNAFPTTDNAVSGGAPQNGLSFPAFNWLRSVGGSLCLCAVNSWVNFATLQTFCRPNGDWNIRANVSTVGCTGGATGACCLSSTQCQIDNAINCQNIGGEYKGDGTTCQTASCSGACCINGNCSIQTAAGCQTNGGTYKGDGSTCAGSPCQTTRACCIPSTGQCVDLDATTCAAVGGVAGGAGTTCATFTCSFNGACCLPNSTCASLNQADCQGQGGSFKGAGTTCGTVSCNTPPAAFSLTTPADNALIASVPVPSSRTPTFNWNASSGTPTPTYTIQIASDSGFTNIVASAAGLTSTSWTSTTSLNYASKYFWRVTASNAAGNTVSTPGSRLFGVKCQADVDNNGSVGANDLSILLSAFGGGFGGPADLDGAGGVGANDLSLLLSSFGACTITLP